MRFTKFAGLLPASSNRHLPSGHAAVAQNVRLTNGTLRAMREPLLLGTCDGDLIPDTKPNDLDLLSCVPTCSVAVGVGDSVQRVKVRNGKLQYHPSNRPVILPAPSAPAIVAPLLPTGTNVQFFATVVGEDGNESLPSPLTAFIRVDPTKKIRADLAGYFRLYMLVTTTVDGNIARDWTSSAEWLVVGDFTDSGTFSLDPNTWDVTADGEDTSEWCDPGVVDCIVRNEDGFFAVWHKNSIWFSERHLEFGWPQRGRVAIEQNIVAIVPYYGSFLILTDGVPYLARVQQEQSTGLITPTIVPFTAHHGLKTPAALSLTPSGVIYPTELGLLALTDQAPNGYQLLTRNIIHAEKWQTTYFPRAGAQHNGLYVSDKWILDLRDTQHGSNELEMLVTHTFGGDKFQSLPDGRLVQFRGSEYYAWERGGFAVAVYRSMTVVEQGLRMYTVMKVVGAEIAGVVVTLYEAETATVLFTVKLTAADNNRPIRMPRKRALHYYVEVILPASDKEIIIKEIHLAPSINDLARNEQSV